LIDWSGQRGRGGASPERLGRRDRRGHGSVPHALPHLPLPQA